MIKKNNLRLAILIFIVSLVVSACSGGIGPKPTEKEIEINPGEDNSAAVGTPVATPTLRPTPTLTATPDPAAAPTEAPTPTNTLNPYDSLIFEGIQLRVNEQFDAAIAKFTEAIQMDPTNAEGFIQRGITYSNINKQDEAITDFNYAINYNPNSAEAYNARGVAWAQKSQYSQAIKDYNKALELDPNLVKAYTNRAIAYMLQRSYENGLADFSKVIELTPDDAEAYFNRGQAYNNAFASLQDPSYLDLCIADFTQSLTLRPDQPEAYFNRGFCASLKGNFVRSWEDYSRAIELDNSEALFYLYRAALFPDLGTQEQALADAQRALELAQDPDIKSQAQLMLTNIPLTPSPTPGATPTPLG